MLNILRKHAASTLIKIILGLIVIVFVFWGFEGFRARQAGRVAIVNGETIGVEEYRSTYNNMIEQYRRNLGNNFTEDTLKMLKLDQKALDYLIDQKLMVQEAERLNMRVSDKELTEAIKAIPVFQTAGTFDSELYKNLLRRIRMSPEEFEYQHRSLMTIEKVRSFVNDNVLVSESESKSVFDFENAETKLDFVLFSPENYTDIEPAEDDLKAYFDENKDRYKTQPQLKVRYLQFSSQDFVPEARISDEEISEYYDANPSEFVNEKSVEARHILLKLNKDASDDQVEEKRKQLLDILLQARGGKDFSELAKTHSEGPSNKDGGYLGTFTKGQMVQPFSEAAFAMKPGEISEPVRTQFGWHIIKVENVNEAKTISLEEATGDIKEKLINEKAKELASEEAESVYSGIFDGDDFIKAAETKNLKMHETDYFNQLAGPETLDTSIRRAFSSASFSLARGDISEVKAFADGYYIIQATDMIESEIPELEAVKERVTNDWKIMKQDERAKEAAQSFLASLKEGADFSEESKALDLKPGETGFFKQNQSIPEIGFERGILEAAPKLNPENTYPEEPIKTGKGYYVIAFKERKLPDKEAFEKEKDAIEKRLLQKKQTEALQKWITNLREKSDIMVEQGVVSS
jgi:peptidyl-prolyl cis-trans isomerase D